MRAFQSTINKLIKVRMSTANQFTQNLMAKSQTESDNSKITKRKNSKVSNNLESSTKKKKTATAIQTDSETPSIPSTPVTPKSKNALLEDVPSYTHEDESSPYEMEIRSARGPFIKKAVEIISPLLTDALLRFTENAVYIIAMDAYKVAVVEAKFFASKFEKYFLKNPNKAYDICVDTAHFHKVLTAVNGADTISFIFENDSPESLQNLIIEAESKKNKSKPDRFRIRVFGINPRSNKFDVPDQCYDSILSIPAKEFDKHIHDMSLLGQTVTFKTNYKKFVMVVKGEFNISYKVIYPNPEGLSFKDEERDQLKVLNDYCDPDEETDEPGEEIEFYEENKTDDFYGMKEEEEANLNSVKEDLENAKKEARERKNRRKVSDKDIPEISFDGEYVEATHIIKYLRAFGKAKDLSSTVELYFEKKQPLVLKYKIGNMGTLTYCIGDVNNDREDDENFNHEEYNHNNEYSTLNTDF